MKKGAENGKPDIAKAEKLLKGAGLIMPPIPHELGLKFRERSKGCFSTRSLRYGPYGIFFYVDEALLGTPRDYVVLAHDGHGANSYAMHYFLVRRPLQLFVQIGWGGAYSNLREDTVLVNECFALARQLVEAVEEVVRSGRLRPEDRLTVVASDFSGGFWVPPGRAQGAKGPSSRGPWPQRNPKVVLNEAIKWCGATRMRGSQAARRSERSRSKKAERDTGIVSEIGGRSEIEDRHVLVEGAGGLFGGVYDGHGGAAVADLAASQLHKMFFDALREERSPEAAFLKAFDLMDQAARHRSCGTTAATFFLRGDQLSVANLGDGRAILVSSRKVEQLTRDHRVDDPEEEARIRKAGGDIDPPYVVRAGHGLMVTRSFGDRMFRAVGVIATPEVSSRTLTASDRYLVAACDGLWDVLKNEEVARIVRAASSAQAGATALAEAVAERRGRDNLTILTVCLSGT